MIFSLTVPSSRSKGDPRVSLLPEHVDLGLRLTVGEDVVQKPSLPSMQGDTGGHFPESSGGSLYQDKHAAAANAYFPAGPGTTTGLIGRRAAAAASSSAGNNDNNNNNNNRNNPGNNANKTEMKSKDGHCFPRECSMV